MRMCPSCRSFRQSKRKEEEQEKQESEVEAEEEDARTRLRVAEEDEEWKLVEEKRGSRQQNAYFKIWSGRFLLILI